MKKTSRLLVDIFSNHHNLTVHSSFFIHDSHVIKKYCECI